MDDVLGDRSGSKAEFKIRIFVGAERKAVKLYGEKLNP